MIEERFKPQIRKDIISFYNGYKKSNKGLKEQETQCYYITKNGLIPHKGVCSIKEQKKENINKLKEMFFGDRYSSKEYLEKNKKTLKESFKDDKEILKIINYSWNKLRNTILK